MATIPLEDNFTDIIGKAQRGLKLSDPRLAAAAGVRPEALEWVKAGAVDEAVLHKLAPCLNLGLHTLLDSARQAWHPAPQSVDGLAQFTTPYGGMTVNAYLVWDPATREAAVFDTGADSAPILEQVRAQDLRVKLILLTHTHGDHIADLARLKRETRAPAMVSALEPVGGAETFSAGRIFELGRLRIETRQTSGHSVGGTTYAVSGLAKPVAVVGDALFAGSMGGGLVSYADALANNREKILVLPAATVICPGHGPLTTVGEEQQHNPFFPEFQRT